jgi:hypothetical protein
MDKTTHQDVEDLALNYLKQIDAALIHGQNMQKKLEDTLVKDTQIHIIEILSRIEAQIKSNLHWNMGLTIGICSIIAVVSLTKVAAMALPKLLGVF